VLYSFGSGLKPFYRYLDGLSHKLKFIRKIKSGSVGGAQSNLMGYRK